MAPSKYPIPRKRSGSMVIFEPIDATVIEQNPNHVDSFKCMGCWRFCHKLKGYHMEVSKDFVHNYRNGKTQVGPLEIHLKLDLNAKVIEIPRIGELWFKANKLEN
jgi:hypothetical protein